MEHNRYRFFVGKYKAIVISIAFFLVFDLGVLILNYLISSKIEQDAVAVNLAGRQRMLSQRMVKSLLEMNEAVQDRVDITPSHKELTLTYNLFNNTLTSFSEGGSAVGGDGNQVLIEKVTSLQGRKAIDDALAIWQPYRNNVEKVLSASPQELLIALPATINVAKANNLKLLKLMNDLTSELEAIAGSKANRLRMIQTTGIMLALGNFFLILFHFLRQLREHEAALEDAKQETDEILGTVNEGLFLLDGDYRIGSQYSKRLEELLGEKNLTGKNFIEILQKHVPDNLTNMSRDYLDLLFEGRVKEKLVTSLNPLHEVEYHKQSNKGTARGNYLDFTFNRVVERSGVKHILVTANDVTQKVALMKELELTERNSKTQIELLLNMLKAEPGMLKQFINKTDIELLHINQILKDHHSIGHSDKLRNIFNVVHTLKGEAAMVKMELFEKRMHEFEEAISGILDQTVITGQDFLTLAVKLESSLQLLEMVRLFLDKLADINNAFNVEAKGDTLLDASQFRSLIERIGSSKGKHVALQTDQFDPSIIPQDKAPHIRDILVQLIRNSVVHGIEHPYERLHAKKTTIGTIHLKTETEGDKIKVVVRDDGRGLSIDTLRNKAIESGQWHKNEVEQWDANRLVSLIFEDRFSTAGGVDEDAGRGVGMAAVKQLAGKIGGGLGLSFAPGRYCEFRILVPAA